MYELECRWSCMWYRQSWIGCAGELEASDNVWAEQMSWSTDGWCPRWLPGRRHSVCAANERRFSSLRRPKQSWRNQPRSDESTGDGFRHVLSEGRANMTHSPDMIESWLGDWVYMVVKSQMFVQRYPQYFDVICRRNYTSDIILFLLPFCTLQKINWWWWYMGPPGSLKIRCSMDLKLDE